MYSYYFYSVHVQLHFMQVGDKLQEVYEVFMSLSEKVLEAQKKVTQAIKVRQQNSMEAKSPPDEPAGMCVEGRGKGALRIWEGGGGGGGWGTLRIGSRGRDKKTREDIMFTDFESENNIQTRTHTSILFPSSSSSSSSPRPRGKCKLGGRIASSNEGT